MIINSGDNLHYPVKVIKLIRRNGDTIKPGDVLFEYEYTTRVARGEEMEWEDVRYVAEFASEGEGVLKNLTVRRNQNITEAGVPLAEIEEACTHEIQFGGLCVDCGKDMEEVTYMTTASNTLRANINMTHGTKDLKVSAREANRTSTSAMKRLLQEKKLSLVVDLDQTIIHAVCDPTVAEWKRDTSNPNHEAVKDVQSFELMDEGPNARASTYYIKSRPGLADFLNRMAEIYELHIYTMGTRAYAVNVAKIVDPTGRFFGDRILSRDESGSMAVKNLSRLFPVDTKMVVIIDDRGDVWTWSPNLVRVKPYVFYVGIGDINSSFLPKLEDSAAPAEKADSHPRTAKVIDKAENEADDHMTGDSEDDTEDDDGKPLAAGLSLGNLEAPSVEDASHLQAEAIAAQVEERPLLKKQEALDKQDEDEASKDQEMKDAEQDTQKTTEPETTTPPSTPPSHRHPLLRNDDEELVYLTDHLKNVHEIFYDMYNFNREEAGEEHEYDADYNVDDDLDIVPDVADILPPRKRDVLRGVVICFTGVIPQGIPHEQSDIGLWAMSFGAIVNPELTAQTTHVVADPDRRTSKVRQAAMHPNIRIVDKSWLVECFSKWIRVPEEPHIIEIELEARAGDALPLASGPPPDIAVEDDGPVAKQSPSARPDEEDEKMEVDGDVSDFVEEFLDNSDDELDLDNINFDEIEAEFNEEDFEDTTDEEDGVGDDDKDGSASVKSSSSKGSSRKRKRKASDAASISSTNSNGVEGAAGRAESVLQQRKKRALERTSSLTAVQNAADLKVPQSVSSRPAVNDKQSVNYKVDEFDADDDEAVNAAVRAALGEDDDEERSSETAQNE